MGEFITEDDVRAYLSLPEKAESEFEFIPSSEDIAEAMKEASRMYNSIPPSRLKGPPPDQLPADEDLFFRGIAAALYRREKEALARQDITYSTGNVAANFVASRIKHLEMLIKEHSDVFFTLAQNKKRELNLNSVFRSW